MNGVSAAVSRMTTSKIIVSCALFLVFFIGLPVFLGSVLVSPATHASTETTTGSNSDYYVSVTSADRLDLSVNAVPGGTLASTSDTLLVSSNTKNGYKVYISSPTATEGSNYLCPSGVTPSTSTCFVPTTSAASLSDLTTNSWGYSLDGTSYKPVPLYGSEVAIISKDEATSESGVATPINFGIKADMGLPSDTYTGTIVYTVFVDPGQAVVECDNTKLCVSYDGNGLTYAETETQPARATNNANYNSTATHVQGTKYSHTPNISDAGVQSGNYANNYTQNEVVTIDGASSLHVKLTYGGESASYDWMSFWEGNYPSYTAAGNYSTGVQNCGGGTVTNGKYGGSNGTTVECDVNGDSVTFAFKSDGSEVGNGYGYYAIVTGSGTTYERTLSSGEYSNPSGTNILFHGWSSTQTTPGSGLSSQVEYADETEVKNKMPGDEGENKTLYAVWQQGQNITFTYDSNVTGITILDSDGNVVGTVSSSGGSVTLAQGLTYTIKPTHASGYTTNAVTLVSGAGTLNGRDFTVGNGGATINVTSKVVPPMQNIASYCPSMSAGDTLEMFDTRDSQIYTVGKLADGNCWMLDNLALDLTNSTVRNAMNENNTHASNTTLNYLRGTSTRDPSTDPNGNYATAGVSNWTSSYSFSAPLVNLTNKDIIPSDAASTAGKYKVGGYYNYCAATAGSYCYGNDTSVGTSSSNATEDICPKGWRLPTGASSGEFQTLYNNASYNTYANYRAALHLPLSGYFLSGSVYYQDIYGSWLSSTRNDNYNMHGMDASTSSVSPARSYSRFYGSSVRCIAGS